MTVSVRQRANGKVGLRLTGNGLVTERTFPSTEAALCAVREQRQLVAHFTVDGVPIVGLLEAALPLWAYPLIPGWSAE